MPYGIAPDGPDTSGMQVAWLNTSTRQSGFVPMGGVSDVVKNAVPAVVPPELRAVVEAAIQNLFASAIPLGGVRAVPVDTGSGTVLSAVFGTVRNGAKSCFFFPTVGVTEAR